MLSAYLMAIVSIDTINIRKKFIWLRVCLQNYFQDGHFKKSWTSLGSVVQP